MPATPQPEPGAGRGYRVFFSQFRENFLLTGALAPSGASLARAITAPLAASGPGPRVVLEVGAGTGVFTSAILDRLRSGDRLDIYEINPVFQPWLEARTSHAGVADRGIVCHLHLAAIETLPPEPAYDYIVSGLPLNNFPPGQVQAILDLLIARLRPGGALSYFEYVGLRRLKQQLVADAAERARLRAVGAVVERFLATHASRQVAVWWNLPPAWARYVSRAPDRG